jgi:predicted transglutaminase-like cysteine proteinase
MSAPALGYNKSSNANLKAGEQLHAPAFGVTLPPIGYVQFCARYKAECRATGNEEPHRQPHQQDMVADCRGQLVRQHQDRANHRPGTL